MPKPSLYFLVTNSLHQDQRLHRICSSLSKNGYDITLVGVKKNQVKYNNEDFNTVCLKLIFGKGMLFYLEVNLRFFFYLLFKKLDGVVANDLDTLLAGKFISKLKNKKLFIDLHEHFSEVPELKGKTFKKSIWNFIGRLGISNNSYNYTVNESLSRILGEKFNSSLKSIYNYPINKENIQLSSNQTFDIVYVGVVNKGRGLKESILTIKDIDDVTLTIFGIGDEFETIKSLISEHKLESRIKLKGFKANQDIHAEIQKYNLGLNLLEPDSMNYYYSSANKYFDYIMAGVPTLSMNFPEYKKHNEQFETSILIDSLATEAIAEAITKVKSDTQLVAQLKLNCTKAKQAFNWKTQETKLLNIYNTAFNL